MRVPSLGCISHPTCVEIGARSARLSCALASAGFHCIAIDLNSSKCAFPVLHVDFADESLFPLFDATACHEFTRNVHFPLPNATFSPARERSKADNFNGRRLRLLRSREHPCSFFSARIRGCFTRDFSG